MGGPPADPDVAGATRVATLTPGVHEVRVTAIVIDDGQPYPIGSCGASLRLVPDQPTVTLSAAMDWQQPACGIAIDPRVASGGPRPDLSTRIRQDGPPPRFRPGGRPTATATDNGVRLQLWVKDVTLHRGQWLLAHARVKNVSDRPIRYPGRFADLDCPPIDAVGATSGLFDPGRSWSGIAGSFKRRWLGSGILQRIGLWIPDRDRGDGCGDVGRVGTLQPGQVVDIPLVALPRYGLGRQPLPPGTIRLSVTMVGTRPRRLVSVGTEVTLSGRPVGYPSPGQLVDAALAAPGFLDVLRTAPPPEEWANPMLSTWLKRPYPPQARLAGALEAPHGIVELGWFFAGITRPFMVGAVIDPWTGEAFSAYGW